MLLKRGGRGILKCGEKVLTIVLSVVGATIAAPVAARIDGTGTA